MKDSTYDLVVIGGGINGTAIALEAVGRGLKTLLCEKGDLACGTSSASTKLIHGGLRYLATFEFGLVAESLNSRKNLVEFAPHLVKPLYFYIPFKQKNFSYWKTKLGVWFYQHIAKLPASSLDASPVKPSSTLFKPEYTAFLNFQDCYTDDARLVIANAKKARELGADIKTHMELLQVTEHDAHWDLQFSTQESITTKMVINAAGTGVEHVHKNIFHCDSQYVLKLIQGSHLLVPKLTEGKEAYLLPTRDNRVLFIIPYLENFSLIGTTDVDVTDTNSQDKNFELTSKETAYLLAEINEYLPNKLSAKDIVGHWSGARALPVEKNEDSNNPSKISREFKLELSQKKENGPCLLSVWGGKLTTHRSLAVQALDLLADKLNLKKHPFIYSQYLNTPHNHLVNVQKLLDSYSFIPDSIKRRWIFNYGIECLDFISGHDSLEAFGTHFGHGLYETEVQYLRDKEWAVTADDILYRRTKLGYFFSDEQKEALKSWLAIN